MVGPVTRSALAKINSLAARAMPVIGLGSTMRNTQAISFAFTYSRWVSGSKAGPPHSAPPSKPGKMIVPSRLPGTNCPALRICQNARELLHALRECAASACPRSAAAERKAQGVVGSGWVSAATSPSRSDFGYFLYSTGKSGAPVSRSNKYTKARFRCLRHRIERLPTASDGNQRGRSGQIPIPNIVMHSLKMPDALASIGFQSNAMNSRIDRRPRGRRRRNPTPPSQSRRTPSPRFTSSERPVQSLAAPLYVQASFGQVS